MKLLCFGTLYNLIYQARGPKVTVSDICTHICNVYGETIGSTPGHLKNGHDDVPGVIKTAARNMTFEAATDGYERHVVPLIKQSMQKPLVLAIMSVLNKDEMQGDTIIGYRVDYEKNKLLSSNTFGLAALLASVFRYVILETINTDFKKEIREIPNDFVASFENEADRITLEASVISEEIPGVPLARTLPDASFNRNFLLESSMIIDGIPNQSTASIYSVDISNSKLRFRNVKQYVVDNIGTYVFSRAGIKNYEDMHRPAYAIGSQAILQFQRAYGAHAETMLGEILLYFFLEHELKAPKIMSKIEFESHSNIIQSNSDGIYLLSLRNCGMLFHQIVFGASNITGNLPLAIDRAFLKIKDIVENEDIELRTVENTAQCMIYDRETTEYMRNIMIPQKNREQRPEMAFGVFLGYTLAIDSSNLSNMDYIKQAKEKLRSDIKEVQQYIVDKVHECGFEGYSFYFYILPFNNADAEKTSVIDEILEGR